MMNSILLQAAAAPAGGGGMSMLIMLAVLFVIMYFFMIRPQQKKQKQEKVFNQDLQKGAWVVTIGGAHGRLVDLNETTCVIDTEAGKIKFERSAISRDLTMLRYGKKEEPKKEEEKK